MAQPDENEYVENATKEKYIYTARKCLSTELVCSHWRYVNWFQMSEETNNFMQNHSLLVQNWMWEGQVLVMHNKSLVIYYPVADDRPSGSKI